MRLLGPSRLPLVAALLLVVAGCRAPGRGQEETARMYSFVFLTTARPLPTLTEAENQAAFAGHFANMTRMAEAGDLHLAGPFGEVRADPDWRGVFVLEGDVERGRELAATDPAVQAGVFVPVVLPFTSGTDFARFAELQRARRAEREADPEFDPTEFDVRPYVLALGAPAGAAREAVRASPIADRTRVSGDLAGPEGPRLALVLDAEEVGAAGEALEALGASADGITWTVSSLWAARALAGLPPGLDD